jgi:MATE family multidrug resistance protein
MSRIPAADGGMSPEGQLPIVNVSLSEIGGEARASFKIAWPLALGAVGHNLLGVVDTAMVGRLGATELAGVSIGTGIYFALSVAAMGLVSGLDPLVSQAVGAGEGTRARAAFRAGIHLALLVAAPTTLAICLAPYLLPLAGISPEITDVARGFLWARAPGALPFILMMAIRGLLQARSHTKPMMLGSIVANALNIFFNWLLIFGYEPLGVPALGVVGSGLASTIATVGQLALLALALRGLPSLPEGGDADVPVRKIATIGLPIGLTLLAEVGAFALVGILAGRIGPEAGSGHQVAIQLASLTFTVSMSIASATSVRVGLAVGRRDMHGMRLAGWVGFGTSAAYMSATSILFLTFAEPLARIMTNRPEVILVAVPLVHIAAAFQLFDGLQVVGAGALRGLGETKSVQRANVIGYYVLGLPIACALAFWLDLAERGLWWGLCVGLGFVAATVVVRWAIASKQDVARA